MQIESFCTEHRGDMVNVAACLVHETGHSRKSNHILFRTSTRVSDRLTSNNTKSYVNKLLQSSLSPPIGISHQISEHCVQI